MMARRCRPWQASAAGARPLRGLIGLMILLAGVVPAASDSAGVTLERVARPGPWPVVSELVGYRGRVWLVNSVKFRNHNAADLYSYAPDTDSIRYEAHLFSQDAGQPVVSDGILYWPFEDPRFSMGRGEIMMTNGSEWRWVAMTAGEAFHVHALGEYRNALYAATSAWRAGLQRSDDEGLGWRPVYDHATPPGRVSRATSLATLNGRLYASLTGPASEQPKMLVSNGPSRFQLFAAWPSGLGASILAVHDGWLYARHRDGAGGRVWRTDGRRVEPVRGLHGFDVRAMAVSGRGLLAVAPSDDGGVLLQSGEGREWRVADALRGEEPVDVDVYRDNVYVGTRRANGRGGLWRVRRAAPPPDPTPAPALPRRAGEALSQAERGALLRELDQALKGAADFGAYRQRLDAVLQRLTAAGAPAVGSALSQRLGGADRSVKLSTFGGAYEVALGRANDWFLLRAIGLNGHGEVPVELLNMPWDEPSNDAEKYFHPSPAAAWAAARVGQNDEATLDALVNRLGRDEPQWLRGDWIGALTTLSGERFGYNAQAWRQWRRAYRGMVPLPAGVFTMGAEAGPDAETPAHEVSLSRFYIDRYEATNNEFARFVEDTGYVTDAERAGEGWHWDGAWHRVPGADWRHPRGPDTSINNRGDHPVVQVSWHDARAYCAWREKRLPTEAEWERAARGVEGRRFAWGDAPVMAQGEPRASYGTDACCAASDADGFRYTAPVGSFPAGQSPDGVHDLTGNVWEWVRDSYEKDFYQRSPRDNPRNLAEDKPRVIRGGGWGNNPAGLRTTLRHANPPSYALSMVGIRCAKDAPRRSTWRPRPATAPAANQWAPGGSNSGETHSHEPNRHRSQQ